MPGHSPFVPVADRVWLAVAEPVGVTIGLVAGSESALLVDTGCHPDQGRALQRSAEATCGLPVGHAVITHAHWDHWYGLAGLTGVISWGHQALAEAARQPDEPADLNVADEQILRPSHPVTSEATIDLGGRTVRLWHPGRAHTASDLVVEVPDVQVMFVGDLLESAGDPQTGPDAYPRDWPKAIQRLLVGHDHWAFVPGHGPVMTADQARNQQHWLADR